MTTPRFHDPDQPGRVLVYVADDRPAAAFRALLADLTPATPPP